MILFHWHTVNKPIPNNFNIDTDIIKIEHVCAYKYPGIYMYIWNIALEWKYVLFICEILRNI